jgi:hypothetical protein
MSYYHVLKQKNYNTLLETQRTGLSLVAGEDGQLTWSNGVHALQKDIFLNKEKILIDWTNEFQEFELPLHQDGAFELINENQICHVKFAFFYKYIDSIAHLPFYIQVKLNDEEIYLNGFGDYDKKDELNKISDYFSVDANQNDTIKFYIRKKFNDVGKIELQPFCYITNGNAPYDGVDANGDPVANPNYDGSQLGSMELYNLKLQKIVSAYTEFDAVSKAYVDSKIYDITDGLSADGILNTIKEINNYLTDNTVADGLVNQLNALQSEISSEVTRASSAEASLSTRLNALESDPTTGASVSAVQSELDATQTGAGLDHNGSYHTSATAYYINTATNLKDADDFLDQALKAEETRAVSAEGTLTANLNTEIFNRETAVSSLVSSLSSEVSRATEAEEALQNALNVVDAREVVNREAADADRLSIRTDFASADSALSTRIDEEEARANAREQDLQTNIDNNYGEMSNLHGQALAAVNNEQLRAEGAETFLEGKINEEKARAEDAEGVIVGELNAQKTKQDNEHNNNVNRLDGHDGNIQELGERPYNVNDGGFNVQHVEGSGDNKYLYFSQKWRMYGKSDGSRLVFEFNSGSQVSPNWKPAVPFISSI